MAQELPMIVNPHSLLVTGSFDGIRPFKQSSNNTKISECHATLHKRNSLPPTDDFPSTVLDPQFVSF